MTSSSDAPHEGASGNGHAGRYYGRGIPYLPLAAYPGKLIAIEGTDGVGRSTQIQLLREWLEVVDAVGSITEQQRAVRALIAKHLEASHNSTEVPREQSA